MAQQPPPGKSINDLKQTQTIQQAKELGLSNAPPQIQIEPPASDNPRTNRAPSAPANTGDPIARIREEGLNHSQVMATLSFLSDVIGPRLTGSPNMKRANEWTRDKLTEWGLGNAHLEAWGPFGRGWTLKRFSAQIVEPQDIPLKAYPNAWSPGFDQPLETDVIYLDAKNDSDLEKYKGKLKGAIVLASPAREVKTRFEPLATRLVETNLLALANADVPRTGAVGRRGAGPFGGTSTTNNAAGPRRGGRGGGPRFLPFLAKEEAALVVTPSSLGDGGTIFVASASVPTPPGQTNNANSAGADALRLGGGPPRISAYSTNAPDFPAQITVAVEDYNRLVRMVEFGEKLKMAVDLRVEYETNDLMAYNTIAEIPGSDLKQEIVMLGGHMDSWQSGTGATDNGAGVAAAMEAVRIIKAVNLRPRRTIRIALWSGEEEGLLGSRAYVSKHFGYFTNVAENATVGARSPRSQSAGEALAARSSNSDRSTPPRKLVRQKEYDRLSTYFNLDNGAGKIRGVYMQGNEAVRPLFRKWMGPFRDLGAETLTPSNTGSTDHVSFDNIGLPGFQFIQDPLDYSSRTHHSNEDVFDRIQPDDMKQAATVLAAFVYEAAMLDEKLPRKPVE